MVLGLFKRRGSTNGRPPFIAWRDGGPSARALRSIRVPDTIEGRMEMVMLHVGLMMSRLTADADRELPRDLSEVFFADMDASLREIGISDVAVPKKMKGSPAPSTDD